MIKLAHNLISHAIWFFQELTLLSSLIIIAAILMAIFLACYCIGVLGAGSKRAFWQKFICFFKRDTVTSFETLATRDPNSPSIHSSYFKYRKQRKRIKHFWQSAAILFGVKIIIILLISTIFQNNPLKAQKNILELTDLNQTVLANQGIAVIAESPNQSPENYYFFDKQGEVKEEAIIGAELQAIVQDQQEMAQLDEFKTLNPEAQDLKINQESLNLVRIDQEQTTGDKIQELFFKEPFDFQEPDLILDVSKDGEILSAEMEGINKDDKLIFSYEFGAYSKSYQTEEAEVEIADDLEIEFDDDGESEFDLGKANQAKQSQLFKTAQAQTKTAKAIRVKLKADTKAGYQVFQVNPDGSLYLYDGEELTATSRPVFEFNLETENLKLETWNLEQGKGIDVGAGLVPVPDVGANPGDRPEDANNNQLPNSNNQTTEKIIPEETQSELQPAPIKTEESASETESAPAPEPEVLPAPEPTPESLPEPADLPVEPAGEADKPVSFLPTKKSAQNADFGGNLGFSSHGSRLVNHPMFSSIAGLKSLSSVRANIRAAINFFTDKKMVDRWGIEPHLPRVINQGEIQSRPTTIALYHNSNSWQNIKTAFNKLIGIFRVSAQEDTITNNQDTIDQDANNNQLPNSNNQTITETPDVGANPRVRPDDVWQPFTPRKVKISKELFDDHIEIALKIATQEGDEILMKYEFGFDGKEFLKKQSWSIETDKQVRMRWETEIQNSKFKIKNYNSKLKILDQDKKTHLGDLNIDVSDYIGDVRTEVDEEENKINVYFENLAQAVDISTIDPAIYLLTPPTEGLFIESSRGLKLRFNQDTGLIDRFYPNKDSGSLVSEDEPLVKFSIFNFQFSNLEILEDSLTRAKIKVNYPADNLELIYSINFGGQIYIASNQPIEASAPVGALVKLADSQHYFLDLTILEPTPEDIAKRALDFQNPDLNLQFMIGTGGLCPVGTGQLGTGQCPVPTFDLNDGAYQMTAENDKVKFIIDGSNINRFYPVFKISNWQSDKLPHLYAELDNLRIDQDLNYIVSFLNNDPNAHILFFQYLGVIDKRQIFYIDPVTSPVTETTQADFQTGSTTGGASVTAGGEVTIAQSSNWWSSNYKYRKQLTITNNDASSALYAPYTAHITQDTSAYSAVQADCDDLRVVHQKDSVNTEIEREINFNGANVSCSGASTNVFFKTKSGENIAASSSDSNYYLYYGNTSATAPSTTETNIYTKPQGAFTEAFGYRDTKPNGTDSLGNAIQITQSDNLQYGRGSAVNNQAFSATWGYNVLIPGSTDLSAKGIGIAGTDNLQYTRGSLQSGDGAGVVYENFDPNQGTLEFWVRPNFAGGDNLQHHLFDARSDANNQVQFYKNTSNNLVFEVKGAGTSQTVSQSISTWTAGTWYHLVAVWDKNNDVNGTNNLYVYINATGAGSATAPTALASLPSTFFIGADYNTANQFNGVIAGRILNRPLTSTEVTALYASGAGHADTFTVTPDTVWLGTYSDSDTDAVFQHRGQSVSTTDADTVNVAQAVGSRSWKDNDRVAVWDGTGYKVEGLINEPVSIATTDTSLELDNLSSANLDKVGKALSFDGVNDYVSVPDSTAYPSGTSDYAIEAWINPSGLAGDWRMIVVNQNLGHFQFGLDNLGLNAKIEMYTGGTGGGGNRTISLSWTLGTWYHVAVTRTSGVVKFYRNGIEYAGGTNTNSITRDSLNIGYRSWGSSHPFNGTIDDVRIYNKALTAADILWLATHPNPTLQEIFDNTSANAGAGGADDDIVLYHNYRNGNLTDLSEYANNGTFNGGTATYPQQAFISRNLIADGGMEQGGIGAWTAGDAATTLAKNTTTVKFDTRSLKITNGDATQAFARQTITTAAGEDYRFHGWFRTPATPNGASQLVDVDGTAALGITVTQAGATTAATWYEVDFTFEAADASTTIDLGSGSITSAEIGYWDNVKIQKNLVNDGGCESALLASWTQEVSATMAADTSEHSGIQEMKITAGVANVGARQAITLISGKYYTVSGWARATSGDSAQIVMDKGDATTITVGTVTATTYTKISASFKSTGTAGNIYLRAVANTDIVWFDDVSIMELDQLDASTATKATDKAMRISGAQGKVYENFDPHQGAIRAWVRPNFDDNEGGIHYVFDNSNAKLYWDGANTQWKATVNGIDITKTSSFSAGSWIHLALSWNSLSPTLDLSVNNATATQVTTAQTVSTANATSYFGESSTPGSRFDGTVHGLQIDNRAWSSTEITADYASGRGIAAACGEKCSFMSGALGSTTDSVSWPENDGIFGNLIADGNGEDGDAADWLVSSAVYARAEAEGASAFVKKDTASFRIILGPSTSANDDYAYVSTPALANSTSYYLSFWYRGNSNYDANAVNAQVFDQTGSNSPVAETQLFAAGHNTNTWSQYQTVFTTDAAAGIHDIRFVQNGVVAGPSNIYIDDLRVHKQVTSLTNNNWYTSNSKTPVSFKKVSGDTNVVDYGLGFDGVDDYVQVNDSNNSLDMTSAVSVSVWIKRDTSTGNYAEAIVSKRVVDWTGTLCNYQFYLAADANRQTRFYNGSVERIVAYTPPVGVWTHLVFMISGGNFIVYANGVYQGATAATLGAVNDAPLWIGFYDHPATDEPFHGLIDDVRIWNVALNANDIAKHYYNPNDITCANTSGCTSANLVGNWKMNDGTGQTATDSSGQGNNGTLGATSGSESSDPTWTSLTNSLDTVSAGTATPTSETNSFSFGVPHLYLSGDSADDTNPTSGTVGTITDNTLTDTGRFTGLSYTPDANYQYWIRLTSGSKNGSLYQIYSNTADVLQISGTALTDGVAVSDTYTIYRTEAGRSVIVDGGDRLTYPLVGNFSNSAGTVSLWVKPGVLSTTRNLFSAYTDASNYLNLFLNSSNYAGADLKGATITGASALKQSWQNLILTYGTGGNLTLYVNGSSQGAPISYSTFTLPTNLEIGSANSANQGDSSISDVRIFNRALTAGEVSDLYSQALTGANNASVKLSAVIDDSTTPELFHFRGLSSDYSAGVDKILAYSRCNSSDTYTCANSAPTSLPTLAAGSVIKQYQDGAYISGTTVNNSYGFDTGSVYLDYDVITITESKPVNTSIAYSVRGSGSEDMSAPSSWCALTSAQDISQICSAAYPSESWTAPSAYRYFQYKADLTNTDALSAPQLQDIQIAFKARPTNGPTLSVNSSNITTSSVQWDYTDDNATEDGFRLYASSTLISQNATPGSAGSFSESGLAVNTQYARAVKAYNTVGETDASNAVSKYTLANVPGVSTVSAVSDTSLKIIIDKNNNPDNETALPANAAAVGDTKYAVAVSTDNFVSDTRYVQSDGTISSALGEEDWLMYKSGAANFGGANGLTITGLLNNTAYLFKVKAKNGDGVTTGYGSTSTAVYTYAPTATDLTASADSTTAITLSVSAFNNPMVGQSGYYFGRTGGSPVPTNSGWIQTSSWQDANLSINTQYTYTVKYRNSAGTETSTITINKYTLANTPGAPIIEGVGATGLNIAIDANSNPASTNFAIAVSENSFTTTQYIQADGTAGPSAVWQTASQWGAQVSATGFTVGATYQAKIRARNGDNAETSFSPESSSITLNQAPAIAINSASQTADGTRYVAISYSLTDADANTCSLANYQYSTDNQNWSAMTEKAGVNSDGITSLTSSQTGISHNFMWNIAVDLANTEDSSVYIRLKPNDGIIDGNFATSSSFAIDTINPEISSVSAPGANITSSTGIITWTTNEITSSKVEYGPSDSYGSSTSETDLSPRVSSHSVNLNNLISCTKYFYRVISKDSKGNSTTSSSSAFTTAGCVAQAVPIQTQTETIDKNIGGAVSVSDITVSVPAQATTVDAVFQVKELNRADTEDTTLKPSENLQPIGAKTYEVKAIENAQTVITNFDQSINITLNYTNSDVQGIIESTLKIYRYSSGWNELSSCSVNELANTVACQTTQFSLFGIFGSPQGGSALTPAYASGSDKQIQKDKILINNGDAHTASPDIIISLESETADLMLVSNQSDFKDASFEKFAKTKQWTLKDPDMAGRKAVYIKFRDKNGALSELYKTEIELIKQIELESAIVITSFVQAPYEPDDEITIKLTIQNKSPYAVKLNSIDIAIPHGAKAKTGNFWQNQTVPAQESITKEIVVKINYPLLESIVQTSTYGKIEYQELGGAIKTEETEETLIALTSSKIIGKVKSADALAIKYLPVYTYEQDILVGIGETDDSGAFIIKGLKAGEYAVYTIKNTAMKVALAKGEVKKDVSLNIIAIEKSPTEAKEEILPAPLMPSLDKRAEPLKEVEIPEIKLPEFIAPEAKVPEIKKLPKYEGLALPQPLPEHSEQAKQIDFLTPKFELTVKPELEIKYKLPELPAKIEQIAKIKAEINQGQIIVGDLTGRIEIPRQENQVHVLAGRLVKFYFKLAHPAKNIKTTVVFADKFKIAEYIFNDDNEDGIYEAEMQAPQVEGPYVLKTQIDDQEPQVLTILIDPEGYVYTFDKQEREVRIGKAVVALWKYDIQANDYLVWQAKDFKQQNPQITEKDGNYSFLAPSGRYYLTALHPDFEFKKTDEFELAESKEAHFNIELKERETGLLSWSKKQFQTAFIGVISSIGILILILEVIALELAVILKKKKKKRL